MRLSQALQGLKSRETLTKWISPSLLHNSFFPLYRPPPNIKAIIDVLIFTSSPAGKVSRIRSKQNKLNNFVHAIIEHKQHFKAGNQKAELFYLTINLAVGTAGSSLVNP